MGSGTARIRLRADGVLTAGGWATALRRTVAVLDFLLFSGLKTTESTEDTEKNGKALCSLSALWLITYTNIPFSYRGCAKQLSPLRSRKKKSVARAL